MTNLVFTDDTGNELQVWASKENKLHIQIDETQSELILAVINLDLEDALILQRELNKQIRIIKSFL